MKTTTLGEKIRELRLKKGLTQTDLARGIVSASMICQIEGNRAHPSHKVLFQLAAKLDVSLESLLKDVDLDLEHLSQYKMAIGFIKFGKYSSAIPLLENLLDAPRTNHFTTEELRYYLGVCYLDANEFDKALQIFESGADNLKFKGDHDLAAKV
ncbi:MAG: helix-turn-helix domain-containing protein, partial [Neobacillus sp.]